MYQLKIPTQVAALTLAIMMSGSFSAHAESSCKTRAIANGITTVTATVKGSATAEDSALCTATYQCPNGARKVQVFGAGVSSSPLAIMAVENAATATNNSEAVLSDCEAQARAGNRPGRYCTGAVSALQQPDSVLASAQCTTFASAPANGKIVSVATCFCDD